MPEHSFDLSSSATDRAESAERTRREFFGKRVPLAKVSARSAALPLTPARNKAGWSGRQLGAILEEPKLRRVLTRILDENEFLTPFGIRSLSRYHRDHPYVITVEGREYRVGYLPAESDSGMFGGNSNWRGPIWMPVNTLISRALLQYYAYYGNNFTVECPGG
jgi:hypothetical protein